MNIVVPMAGRGSRFQQVGYVDPKPLIQVAGKSMIERVISNLTPSTEHRFIFICQREHLLSYPIEACLLAATPGCVVLTVDRVTEGAACTVLIARAYIDDDEPLMIANCDQLIDVSIDEYLSKLDTRGLDGLIMTMTAAGAKWSYVKTGEDGLVTRVVEKEVISTEATVGIYNFARGRDFIDAADQMIEKKLKVNNEYYVAPVYEQMIANHAKIGTCNIGQVDAGMYGLGTPEDLEAFLEQNVLSRFTHKC